MSVIWVLGIDVGSKKTGVAVGQSVTGQAKPLTVLKIPLAALTAKNFERFVLEWRVNCIVIGLPTLADGKPHPLDKGIRRLAAELAQYFSLSVYFADETLTSHEGRHRFGKWQESDSAAAAVMVEDFLISGNYRI